MRSILLTIALGLVPQPTAAASADSVVLTYWGQWTVDEATNGLHRAQALGASRVTILVMLCQDGVNANSLVYCFDNGADLPWAQSYQYARLQSLVPEILALGMTFNLMPYIDSTIDAKGGDRHYLWPSSPTDWFASYGNKMSELSAYAQSYRNESFIIASELTSMYLFDSYWRSAIAAVRAQFSGHVTLSSVIGLQVAVTFWDALDSIGVSAYFPLATNDTTDSVFEFTIAWLAYQQALDTFAATWGKPIRFVELGYPNTNYAAYEPWDYDFAARTLDENLPADCYQAFGDVWGNDQNLQAFELWGISTPENDAAEPKNFNPSGKPSAAVLQQIFAERAQLR